MALLPILAQTAAAQPAPGGSAAGTLFMFGSIFAIFYFLVIRPQAKERKAHEGRVMGIKKGDQIVTAGGIVGEVVHIAAGATAGLGDHVTVKSGESRLIVTRGRIVSVGGSAEVAA